MGGQLNYGYQPPLGLPGTLDDLSNKDIDSRLNGETSVTAMQYGMGVMEGTIPGIDVLIPTTTSTIGQFEGVSMNGKTTQQTMDGKVLVYPGDTVGVLRWGRPWVRIAPGLTIGYNDPVFLIISGADVGKFTNVDGGTGTLAVKATFTGKVGTGEAAVIYLRHQINE